jgi:type II secretory pathway pseudopilin PulG
MRRTATLRHYARGFTYLGILMLLAVVTLVGAAGLQLGLVSHRRAAEQALLETGAAFGAALRSYARVTPQGQSDAPRTLQNLLKDPRFPGTVRHLRKIFVDPMTGKDDWGLIQDEQGDGIVGVYSLAKAKPIKQAGFDGRFTDFDGKLAYADWKFTRPEEPDVHGTGLSKGLVSGGVLRGDGREVREAGPNPPLFDNSPNFISPWALR